MSTRNSPQGNLPVNPVVLFLATLGVLTALAPIAVFAFDFRTLNYVTDPVSHPLHSTADPVEPLPQGFDFESGIVSSPTAFSFDIPKSDAQILTHPHLSFFLSPGIRVAYRKDRLEHAANLVYHGAFDFYYGSMTSGPVLSRLQNPELYYEIGKVMDLEVLQRWGLKFGAAHESNGMFVDSLDQYNHMRATLPFDYDAQDFASIGWNYWLLEGDAELKIGTYRLKPHLGLRLYTSENNFFKFSGLEDTSLFYPGAKPARYPDYDGLVLLLPLEVPMDFCFLRWPPLKWFPWSYAAMVAGIQTAGLQMESPKNLFRYATYHFALKGRWLHLPWLGFLKYEYGYTQPIAYYPVRSHRFSMGIEFKNYRFGASN